MGSAVSLELLEVTANGWLVTTSFRIREVVEVNHGKELSELVIHPRMLPKTSGSHAAAGGWPGTASFAGIPAGGWGELLLSPG